MVQQVEHKFLMMIEDLGSAYAHNSTNVFGNLSANFIDSPNTTRRLL